MFAATREGIQWKTLVAIQMFLKVSLIGARQTDEII